MVSALKWPPPDVIVAADEELVSVTSPTSVNPPALNQLPPTLIAWAPVTVPAVMVKLPVTRRVSMRR